MSRQAKASYAVFAVAVVLCAGFAAVALVHSNSQRELASFSTDLAPRDGAQRHNIVRAASKIDGTVLRPGMEFSFNKTVGLCGVAQGYERAPTIIDGELRPAWGGGVCQVSSTLYNAALLANLKITERHAHSRRVRSVPPGRDATTAFGIADLRFVNTTASPITIRTKSSRTRLTISILGKGDPEIAADVRTEVIRPSVRAAGGRWSRTLDSSRHGDTVLTYRIVTREGTEISRELISKDIHAAPTDSAAPGGRQTR